MTITRRTILAAAALALPGQASNPTVRIGQANPALSFLPLVAARALDTFPAAGLSLAWSAIPGDLAALAALDRGDIDYAAIGSQSLLAPDAKTQPVQIVAALMSKVSLELVVANKVLSRSAVSPPDDPVKKRLQLLKGLAIGVTAAGGAQARAARWLARQAGLDPTGDIQIIPVGPPQAIQEALAAARIDAFLLSPPEGAIAENARTGRVLVRMGDDFPALRGIPFLVLAAKTPLADPAPLVATLRALQAADATLLADPAAAANAIQRKLLPNLPPPAILSALAALKTGIEDRGRLTRDGIAALVAYAGVTGLDPAAQAKLWTDQYWLEAARA